MTFEVDTGWSKPDIQAVSAAADRETQIITIVSVQQARTIYRKITENIQAHEEPDLLDAYMDSEDLALDALHIYDPHLWSEIKDIYEQTRLGIAKQWEKSAKAVPHRTASGTQTAQQPINGNDGKERKDDEYWI